MSIDKITAICDELARRRDEYKDERNKYKAQLNTLAEAADNMLTLLVDNAPLDGLWSGDIDEWAQLIKEGKKL